MDKKTLSGSKIADLAGKIVKLLEDIASEDRQKIIRGALTMLGESSPSGRSGSQDSSSGGEGDKSDLNVDGLSARAKTWMKQNGLVTSQVEEVFHIAKEGGTVIASILPGKNGREKTLNAFVLQGLSQLLTSGEPDFTDQAARKVCEDFGCYDPSNHSYYMRNKRNLFAGSKKTGWKLTAPGLKHGADLVKELTKKE